MISEEELTRIRDLVGESISKVMLLKIVGVARLLQLAQFGAFLLFAARTAVSFDLEHFSLALSFLILSAVTGSIKNSALRALSPVVIFDRGSGRDG